MSPKAKRKPKRVKYQVVHGGWLVLRDGKEVGRARIKEVAVAIARARARREKIAGQPTQLLVSRTRGQFRQESTFGNDPRRTRG